MPKVQRRTQAERSSEMRRRLIAAAVDSLVEHGHARTTAVEVCRRASVTRGAFHHHFHDLATLLAATMADTYERYFLRERPTNRETHVEWIDRVWSKLRQPQFKAVIEVWLAARNHPDLAAGLQPQIDKYARMLSISGEARQAISGPAVRAFYRLCIETMLGLALGRATTPGGKALRHEETVLNLLREMASHIR